MYLQVGRIVKASALQAVEPGFDSPRGRLLFQHCQNNRDVIRKIFARKKVARVKIQEQIKEENMRKVTSYDKISRGKNWLS